MTITLSGVLTLDVGKDITMAVELGRIHESMIQHCLIKGFDPLLRDSHASATLKAADGDEDKMRETARALVAKKLESLYDGSARIKGERRESTSDPMSKLRTAALRELWEGKHGKGAWAKLSKREDAGEFIAKLMAHNSEKIEARALEMKQQAEEAAKKAKEVAATLVEDFDL